MITRAQAETAASRAVADVKAAAAEIARVNTQAMMVIRRVQQAKTNGDVADAAGALRDADGVAQDMVRTRVRYQHAVEVANVVQSMSNLKRRAEAKRNMHDAEGAVIDDAAAEAAVTVLLRLNAEPPPIKVPPPTADLVLRQISNQQRQLEGLGDGWNPFEAIGAIANQVGAKLNQFGNWVVDNGPVVGGAVGTVVGAVIGGPPGAAAGGAAGTALGKMLQATKPQVVNQTPPPSPPVVASLTALTLPQSGATSGGGPSIPNMGPPSTPGATPNVGVGPNGPVPQTVSTQPAFNDPTAKVASSTFSGGSVLPLAIGGGAAALLVGIALLKGKR